MGLGNPGKKYKDTRHNIGFCVADKFRKINNFPEFKLSKKFNSLISEGILNGKKIIIAKPQTFMNKSGEAVRALTNFYKTKDLFVIHDDIDLLLGKTKIVKGRGSAGHKGIESIIKEISTKKFIRFRVGIQSIKAKPKNAEKFVLQKFEKEEKKIVKEIIKKTVEAIETTMNEGSEKAMNEYNK